MSQICTLNTMSAAPCSCTKHQVHDTLSDIECTVDACKAPGGAHDCICMAPNLVLFNDQSGQRKLRVCRDLCKAGHHPCACIGEPRYMAIANDTCRAEEHACICEEARTGDDCRAEDHDCICNHDDEPDCDCFVCHCFERRLEEDEEKRKKRKESRKKRARV